MSSESETGNNLDKFVSDKEKKEILDLESQLEGKQICVNLKKEGKFFYYCKKFFPCPKFLSRIDFKTLKKHCMHNYEECDLYLDMLKKK